MRRLQDIGAHIRGGWILAFIMYREAAVLAGFPTAHLWHLVGRGARASREQDVAWGKNRIGDAL